MGQNVYQKLFSYLTTERMLNSEHPNKSNLAKPSWYMV
jgi:hypothetical protein